MDNNCVCITVEDCYTQNCCTTNNKKNAYISGSTQTINLQNNYILNVIRIEDTFFTIMIQNGFEVIIRNIFTSYTSQILIPDRCARHIVSVSGEITSCNT